MSNNQAKDHAIIDMHFANFDVLQKFGEEMAKVKFADRVASIVRLIKALGIYDKKTLDNNVSYVFDMAVPGYLHNNWI